MSDHTGLFRFDADEIGLPEPALSVRDLLEHLVSRPPSSGAATLEHLGEMNDRYGQAVNLFVQDFGDVLRAAKDMRLPREDVELLVSVCVGAFNEKQA